MSKDDKILSGIREVEIDLTNRLRQSTGYEHNKTNKTNKITPEQARVAKARKDAMSRSSPRQKKPLLSTETKSADKSNNESSFVDYEPVSFELLTPATGSQKNALPNSAENHSEGGIADAQQDSEDEINKIIAQLNKIANDNQQLLYSQWLITNESGESALSEAGSEFQKLMAKVIKLKPDILVLSQHDGASTPGNVLEKETLKIANFCLIFEENLRLKESYSFLDAAKNLCDAELSGLKEELSYLRKEHEALQIKLATENPRDDSYSGESRLQGQSGKNEDLVDQFAVSEAQLFKISELEEQIASLSKVNLQLQKVNNELVAEGEARDSQLTSFDQANKDLQRRLKLLQSAQDQLIAQLDAIKELNHQQLQTLKEEYEKELDAAKKALSALGEANRGKDGAASQEIERLENENKQLRTLHDQDLEAQEKLRIDFERSQLQHQKQAEDGASVILSLNIQHNKEIATLKEELRKLQMQLRNLPQSNNLDNDDVTHTFRSGFKALGASLDSSGDLSFQLEEVATSLNAQITGLSSEVDRLKAEKAKLEKEVEAASRQKSAIDTSKTKDSAGGPRNLTTLEEKLQSLVRENALREDKIREVEAGLTMIKAFESRNKELSAELERLINEEVAARKALALALLDSEAAQKELNDKNRQLNILKQNGLKLEETVKSLQEQLDSLSRQKDDLLLVNEDSKSRIDELEYDIDCVLLHEEQALLIQMHQNLIALHKASYVKKIDSAEYKEFANEEPYYVDFVTGDTDIPESFLQKSGKSKAMSLAVSKNDSQYELYILRNGNAWVRFSSIIQQQPQEDQDLFMQDNKKRLSKLLEKEINSLVEKMALSHTEIKSDNDRLRDRLARLEEENKKLKDERAIANSLPLVSSHASLLAGRSEVIATQADSSTSPALSSSPLTQSTSHLALKPQKSSSSNDRVSDQNDINLFKKSLITASQIIYRKPNPILIGHGGEAFDDKTEKDKRRSTRSIAKTINSALNKIAMHKQGAYKISLVDLAQKEDIDMSLLNKYNPNSIFIKTGPYKEEVSLNNLLAIKQNLLVLEDRVINRNIDRLIELVETYGNKILTAKRVSEYDHETSDAVKEISQRIKGEGGLIDAAKKYNSLILSGSEMSCLVAFSVGLQGNGDQFLKSNFMDRVEELKCNDVPSKRFADRQIAQFVSDIIIKSINKHDIGHLAEYMQCQSKEDSPPSATSLLGRSSLLPSAKAISAHK